MLKVTVKQQVYNVLQAEYPEDRVQLIEQIASEISWRYKEDKYYEEDGVSKEMVGKKFHHHFANYPIVFDSEAMNGYLKDKKCLSIDELVKHISEIKEKEYNKQLTKLKDEKRAMRKAIIEAVREQEKYKPVASMYIWQMAFGTNGTIIIGRTWQQFIEVLAQLKESFKLDKKRGMYIYIHNLRYDWFFFKNYFKWDSNRTFLRNDEVYYTSTKELYYEEDGKTKSMEFEGFTFRDSYALSGVGLEELPDIMVKYSDKCFKLKDYDYDKARHSETELNNEELAYCINDVIALSWYIREKLEETSDYKGPNINRIAITCTQEVKNECRNRLYYTSKMYKNPRCAKSVRYHSYMDKIKIDYALFQQIRRAFQGGYCHMNRQYVGRVFYDEIMAADAKSQYPAMMVMSNEYPVGPYEVVDVKSMSEFNYYITTYSCLFDVILYDVKPKVALDFDGAGTMGDGYLDFDYIDQIISCSKLEEFGKINPKLAPIYPKDGYYTWEDDKKKWYKSNGRLRYADRICMTITHIDWKAICRFYDFDKNKVKVCNFRIAKKGYLPKPIIEYVMELFRAKCSHEEESLLYKVSKRKLNSLFGMMAYNVLQESYLLDEDNKISKKYGKLTKEEREEVLKKELDEQVSFLCYSWSTILTGEARWALYRFMSEGSKLNHVYADTDCDFFRNNKKTLDWIEAYNNSVDIKMNKCFKYYDLPRDYHKVQSSTGEQCLGYFYLKNGGKPYKRFVGYRAKAYLYEDEKGNHITCSGVTKDAIDYLEEKYGDDLYDVFGKGRIEVDANHSGRMIAYYSSEEIEGTITDYNNKKFNFSENGFVHLEKVPFNMKECEDYDKVDDLMSFRSLENYGGLY